MKDKFNLRVSQVVILLMIIAIFSCSKSNNKSTTPNKSNISSSTNYKGVLVGSTGYISLYLKGSSPGGGANLSYILVTYVDSSKTPVYTIKDSLTTNSLNNWQPGTAISNGIFTGNSGIIVTLISIEADGRNPVTKIQVPNDPYVKVFMEKDSVLNNPLLVFIGKAVPVVNGTSGTGGSCNCNAKTMNFVINPAFVGDSSLAATAIYIDTYSHLAGYLNAQIFSSNPDKLTQIINNNDIAGLNSYNGPGGPNSNNSSGTVNGSLQISTDRSSLSGTISGMYNPSTGNQASSCPCTYTVFAKKVQ